jgi:hypothetical protein
VPVAPGNWRNRWLATRRRASTVREQRSDQSAGETTQQNVSTENCETEHVDLIGAPGLGPSPDIVKDRASYHIYAGDEQEPKSEKQKFQAGKTFVVLGTSLRPFVIVIAARHGHELIATRATNPFAGHSILDFHRFAALGTVKFNQGTLPFRGRFGRPPSRAAVGAAGRLST